MTKLEKLKNYIDQHSSMLIIQFDGAKVGKTSNFRTELVQEESGNTKLNLYTDSDMWFFSLDEKYLLEDNKIEKGLLEKEAKNETDEKYYHYNVGVNRMGKPYLYFYTLTRTQYKKAIEIFQS